MHNMFLVKENSGLPTDVCHIYEHWFYMTFRKRVSERLKIDPGLIGMLAGETYGELIFFECYLYDERLNRLFKEFIADKYLDEDRLKVSLDQCAAEERVSITITNKSLFDKQIKQLIGTPFQEGSDLKPFVYADTLKSKDSPLSIHKDAKRYKCIGIEIGLAKGASLEDRALYLRLYVIIQDIVSAFLQANGWYHHKSIDLKDIDNHMFTALSFILPKPNFTNKQIENDIKLHLRSLDVSLAMPYIAAHFHEFANNPFLQGEPRHSLHYIDVVAGNRAIAELATKDRIKRIISNLEVVVFNMTFPEADTLIY